MRAVPWELPMRAVECGCGGTKHDNNTTTTVPVNIRDTYLLVYETAIDTGCNDARVHHKHCKSWLHTRESLTLQHCRCGQFLSRHTHLSTINKHTLYGLLPPTPLNPLNLAIRPLPRPTAHCDISPAAPPAKPYPFGPYSLP